MLARGSLFSVTQSSHKMSLNTKQVKVFALLKTVQKGVSEQEKDMVKRDFVLPPWPEWDQVKWDFFEKNMEI